MKGQSNQLHLSKPLLLAQLGLFRFSPGIWSNSGVHMLSAYTSGARGQWKRRGLVAILRNR